jgi:ABC-type Fe3+-hydroxamate transport system substrate-binding protein
MNPPQRVVSLSPNVSMMLFALGIDAEVVGRTAHCLPAIQHYLQVWGRSEHDVEPRLRHWRETPVVGVWPLAHAEPIQALQPDAILTSGSGPFGVHEAEAFGVAAEAMFHFDTRTFHDLEQHIREIGALLGVDAAATALMQQVAAKRDEIIAPRVSRGAPPTVLFEYCVCTTYDADPERRVAEPARTILVGGHLAPELIRLSGGEPVLVQPGDPARWVAFDEIHKAQPEVVLYYDCHGCPMARRYPVRTRRGWDDLPAVTRGAVYAVSENISNPNLCFPAPLEKLVDIFNTDAQRAGASAD